MDNLKIKKTSKTKEKFIEKSSESLKVDDSIWFHGGFHRITAVEHRRFERVDGDKSKYVMIVGILVEEYKARIWIPGGWQVRVRYVEEMLQEVEIFKNE